MERGTIDEIEERKFGLKNWSKFSLVLPCFSPGQPLEPESVIWFATCLF
jgi:hypothetical protein